MGGGCGLRTQHPGPHAGAGHTTNSKGGWLSLSFPFILGNSVFLLTGDKISRSSRSKLQMVEGRQTAQLSGCAGAEHRLLSVGAEPGSS